VAAATATATAARDPAQLRGLRPARGDTDDGRVSAGFIKRFGRDFQEKLPWQT